jgi:phospholipid N-methyltransferase
MDIEATETRRLPGARVRLADRFLFARHFVRDPYMLGSVFPSSRHLVDAVLAQVDWSRARTIVEYGPGIGTFTAEILRRMRTDARLLVVETNAEFVQFIGATLPDNRLSVEYDSAENLPAVLRRRALPRPDCIISGIPLGSMPTSLQMKISSASRDALDARGPFIVYQFTARVLPVLRAVFPDVRRARVLRNLPPAQMMVCRVAERERKQDFFSTG